MFVAMIGKNEEDVSWFRKISTYCFEFSYNKKRATDLTQEEAHKVLSNKDFYLKMYDGKRLILSE